LKKIYEKLDLNSADLSTLLVSKIK